jgi:hypothetical protein
VGRAVIGDQLLDSDAVVGEVRDGAAQKADRGRGLLVAENLDIGESRGVVDRDVHVLAIWRPGSASAQLELVGLRLEYARTALARDANADWIAARLQRTCSELGTCVTRIAEQRFRVEPA